MTFGQLSKYNGLVKWCPKCQQQKPFEEFGKRGKGYQPYCKPCNKAYLRNHYKSNKQYYVDKAQRNAQAIREMLYEYLSTHPCSCGESRVPCLQFDHLDPETKSFKISGSWVTKGREQIFAEIEKCSVLCANCHAMRTAEQFGWYAFDAG